jgi:hypothetical protein
MRPNCSLQFRQSFEPASTILNNRYEIIKVILKRCRKGFGEQPTYVVALGLLRINAARRDQDSSLTGLMPFDRRLELVESNVARRVQHPIRHIQFKEVMVR